MVVNPGVGPVAAPGWYETPRGPRYFDGYRWVEPAFTEMRAHPGIGWGLLAAGALAVVGSFMDWATALNGLLSKAGTDGGDGWITLGAGLLMAGLGLLVGLRQGSRPISIVAAVLGLVVVAVAVVDLVDVSDRGLGVGAGLWVVFLAGAVGAALGITGAFVRVRT